MRIGKSIIRLRKEQQLSQEQLAEELQVSRQTISNWENEKSYPDLSMMVTISNKYNISLDQFLKEDETIIPILDKKIKRNKILKISLTLACLLCIFMTLGISIKTYQKEKEIKETNKQYKQILENIKVLGFENSEVGFYNLTENNTTYKVYTKKPQVLTDPNFMAITTLEDVIIFIDYQGKEKIAVTYIAKEKTTLYCTKKGKLFNEKQNKVTAELYHQYESITTPAIQRLIELYTEIYK